jgi:hypothetical protein
MHGWRMWRACDPGARLPGDPVAAQGLVPMGAQGGAQGTAQAILVR